MREERMEECFLSYNSFSRQPCPLLNYHFLKYHALDLDCHKGRSDCFRRAGANAAIDNIFLPEITLLVGTTTGTTFFST